MRKVLDERNAKLKAEITKSVLERIWEAMKIDVKKAIKLLDEENKRL
ncbi:MAG: hypothetical protein ACUVQ5_06290 [Candidatus Methanomethylicaceae archaeon]